VTINILPDDVLLYIFNSVRLEADRLRHLTWWHRFVHVCRRWRSIIFESPNSLDLRIVCAPRTRTELLGIWPPLPIIITNTTEPHMPNCHFEAAIVHRHRVCEIDLYLEKPRLQLLASTMQEQFPALIHLKLASFYDPLPALVLPDRFLGGSASHLRSLKLNRISFPTLPNLLLSATDLVCLALWNLPDSGYISPEAFVTGLAALPNLESLTIEFNFSSSLPDRGRRHPLQSTRIVLPALTYFEFQGVYRYSEDLMAQIDAPLLDTIHLTFHQSIFNIPELAKFMRRTTRFQAFNEAHVNFDYEGILVQSLPPTPFDEIEISGLRIICEDVDWDPSSLAQILTSLFPSIYVVECLYIYGSGYMGWGDDIESMQWLEIFHPFTAVKKLYISQEFAAYIAPALQELVRERATDVLPALECLFLENLMISDLFQEQLLGRPVTISHWVR
jgi:F-box-like